MFIFLCAEVTAVAMLVQYISGTSIWITAIIVITTTLIYTLYGGLRASIFTDNIQFFIIILLFLITINYLLFSRLGHDKLKLTFCGKSLAAATAEGAKQF